MESSNLQRVITEETLPMGLKNLFELWRFRVIEVRIIESLLYIIFDYAYLNMD